MKKKTFFAVMVIIAMFALVGTQAFAWTTFASGTFKVKKWGFGGMTMEVEYDMRYENPGYNTRAYYYTKNIDEAVVYFQSVKFYNFDEYGKNISGADDNDYCYGCDCLNGWLYVTGYSDAEYGYMKGSTTGSFAQLPYYLWISGWGDSGLKPIPW